MNDRPMPEDLRLILDHALLLTEAYVIGHQYRFLRELLPPGAREGCATLEHRDVIIRTPRPDDVVGLAIGLHECGHVIHGHLWRVEKFVGHMDTPALRAQMRAQEERDTIPNEMEASRFALNALRLHRLHPMDIERAERFLIGSLVQYGADPHYAQQHLTMLTLRTERQDRVSRYDQERDRDITTFGNEWPTDWKTPEPWWDGNVKVSITVPPDKGSGFPDELTAELDARRHHPDAAIRTFGIPGEGWTWILLKS